MIFLLLSVLTPVLTVTRDMTTQGSCDCGDLNATVNQLMKCKIHLSGHKVVSCPVCEDVICRLFFRKDHDVQDGQDHSVARRGEARGMSS